MTVTSGDLGECDRCYRLRVALVPIAVSPGGYTPTMYWLCDDCMVDPYYRFRLWDVFGYEWLCRQ